MSEDPNSKTYRAKRVPESGATLGQSNPVQADYQLLAQILQISEQDAIKILQARTLPAPGAPLHLPSFGPEVEKLITEVVENPLVSAAARAGQPINPIDRSLSPEVPPPALVPTKNWYSALSDEAKAQADRVMGFMNWGLNQVQEAVDTGVGVGVSYVGLPTGEQMQVPWPINGSFGRFAINPLTQSDEGALLIDTADGVVLNIAGTVTATISGPVTATISGPVTVTGSVSITGTPTVTISGTPTVTISGTPTVTISGSPTFIVGNASIDVATISNGGDGKVIYNGTIHPRAFVTLYTVLAGFRATLLRAQIGGTTGDSVQLFVLNPAVGGTGIVEFITPSDAVIGSNAYQIGASPSSDVVIPNGIPFLAGDALAIDNTSQTDTLFAYCELWVEPL